MRHRRRRRRLGVKTKHRKALLRNLVRGLALHREIETTFSKAKEAARLADKMVTIAKVGTLAARRLLIRRLASQEVAHIFIQEIAPRFQDRKGGYTRVLRTSLRPGDSAQKAIVSFTVPIELPQKEKKTKKEKEKKKKPLQEKPPAVSEEKETKPKEKKKAEKPADKKETEKRGGFLSKLRKFLTGEEENK